MWSELASIVTTIGLGAVGWFASHFFAADLIRFYHLRTAIYESMVYFSNVSADSKDYDDAYKELRRLSSQLEALIVTAPPLARIVATLTGL